MEAEILRPTKYLKEVHIDHFSHQVTKFCTSTYEEEEPELVDQVINNVDLCAWAPSDMSVVDTKVARHRLPIHPSARSLTHKNQKVGKEKRVSINEKVRKLPDFRFIMETKYPTWIANMVIVRKLTTDDTCV